MRKPAYQGNKLLTPGPGFLRPSQSWFSGAILYLAPQRIMKDHMSILEFCQRFPDEKACMEFIAQQRWQGMPQCPHCGGSKVYHVQGSMGYTSAQAAGSASVSVPALSWSAPACR